MLVLPESNVCSLKITTGSHAHQVGTIRMAFTAVSPVPRELSAQFEEIVTSTFGLTTVVLKVPSRQVSFHPTGST